MSRRSSDNIRLSPLDRRILNRLQEDIPFKRRPWKAVAVELGIKEEELLKKIAFFKKTGVIRRISAVFSPRKINFQSTLVGAKVSPDSIEDAVKKINGYPEVTHNYRREDEYNIWFTLVARNRKRIDHILRRIKKIKGIERLSEFPTVKLFKISVKFPL